MTSSGDNNYGPGTGDISGTNYDWGKYNAIYIPQTGQTDPAGLWRTLTIDEWRYLLGTSGSTRGGKHTDWWIFNKVTIQNAYGTNEVKGLIIYPDGVREIPALSVSLTKNNVTSVSISKADFDKLEAMGCVFLPAAGYREEVNVQQLQSHGNYWSSTHGNNGTAYYLVFRNDNNNALNMVDPNHRYWGRSVRLVKDIE